MRPADDHFALVRLNKVKQASLKARHGWKVETHSSARKLLWCFCDMGHLLNTSNFSYLFWAVRSGGIECTQHFPISWHFMSAVQIEMRISGLTKIEYLQLYIATSFIWKTDPFPAPSFRSLKIFYFAWLWMPSGTVTQHSSWESSIHLVKASFSKIQFTIQFNWMNFVHHLIYLFIFFFC